MRATDRRTRLTLGLPSPLAERLAELADRDFRSPSHEAAALLVEAIEREARRRERASRVRTQLVDDTGSVR